MIHNDAVIPSGSGSMNSQHGAQLQPLLLPDLKETGKELGRGAYGVVTEVIVSGTTCAAKKLHDTIVQDHNLKKFSDEVLLHSQQRHPNIVQLIGVYYPPRSQLPMLVMEYLPLSLTQCLEREELPLQMKYSILLDVAKGLCYLHGKRPPIVHRDLTANNVLLTSSYSAKISDLGVSRLADTFKKDHLTTAPGNAMVMPPEALEDNPVYDHKLDVFSYGCLILHVLTGQLPKPTDQSVQEPDRVKCLKKEPEWNKRSSYTKKIPKENELLPFAKQCLHDDPTGRPEMIEFLQFIQQIISKFPKMKNRSVLEKELNDAIQEKEEAEKKLDEEKKVAERIIRELREENAANKRENEDLKNEKEQMTTDLKTLSSRVTGLQNVLSLKEKKFNDSTQPLVKYPQLSALDLLPARLAKMDRAQLQPLLLPDLKETGKELGRGAYGVATEVIVSETTCAAKKLHDAIVQVHTLKKFGDEVLLHSEQRHPNIVQLIGVYYPPHSQLPMLVMEYLPLSLTQCLKEKELPLQMKYSILLDVAKGLCYLHGKRPKAIVHRDLTANNVLLTSSYSAKISDLGVSRLVDTFKKNHLTTVPGNAMVMPPEALKDNPVYDHKLDVFSYGCLILHILTGQFPQPTNQFVPEPGRVKSFIEVSEWDRRLSYIEDIPKENELLPLARDCLDDAPTGRPEMIESYQFVKQVLSEYPKIKDRLVVEKELKDAIQEKEEMEEKLVLAERSIHKLKEENAATKIENEDLKNEKEQMTAD
uniref:Protein kinase domain-containing protein n=2 Tax=Amphimedon queenslandica TaxID=400682 RepID=A0A1X7UBI1_AMPQE